MADMKFPRYIFTIGGAGKELIYAMLGSPTEIGGSYAVTGKDWIVREIIRPKPSPVTVDITIIDTALEDENKDLGKIKAIQDNIDKITTEYSSAMTDPNMSLGRIRIAYELLTKKMTLTTPSSLVGIGDEIKTAKLAKVWWINDPQLGEDWLDKVMAYENLRQLDFSKGVYRKRAISKAIYYKAISSNLFKPNILKNDQVDIIIGLGGGTGAGIAIDMARRLKTIQPTANITLFGILSTINESQDEKSNNFAMLTELEYSVLTKDDTLKNMFKNIVLVPIEKTEYGGKQRTTHEYQKLLEEFDKTFAYIFIAYHNTGPGERLFSGLPDFAPFVIATSQLVHYNIDAIKKFKEELYKILKEKDRSFEEEDTIYGIKNVIDQWYPDTIKATLFDQDEILIKERLDKFNAVLRHKTFNDLKYEGISQLIKAVDAGMIVSSMVTPGTMEMGIENSPPPMSSSNPSPSFSPISEPLSPSSASPPKPLKSNIEIQIESIKSQILNFPVGGKFKDDIDQILYDILRKDIDMLEKRMQVLKSINKVDDSVIKLALRSIIKGEQLNLGVGQREISKEINILTNKEKELEKKSQEWKQENIKHLESLNLIDDFLIELNKKLIYINDELNEYANRLNNSTRIKDISSIEKADLIKLLETLQKDIDKKVELEFKDKNSIIESISILKELRRNQIEYKHGVKLVYKLTGKARSIKQKINNNIQRLNAEIESRKVFKVKDDSTFITIYTPDIEQKINEKKEKIIEDIDYNTKRIFPNVSTQILSSIKGALRDSVGRKDLNIKNITGNFTERLSLLKAFDNKLASISPIIATYSLNLDNYYKFIDNLENNVEKIKNPKLDTIYVTEAQPKNLLQIMAKESDINDMIKNVQEMSNLKIYLDDGLSRTLDNNYNVLSLLKIESARGTKSWDRTKVMCSLISTANIGPNIINAEKQIRDAFNPGAYADWVCPWGDPWEIGLALFIAGVPLDNIKNVVDAKEGFYAKYKKAEPKIFFYHALMLEDGNLVKRKRIFSVDVENEKALLLQDNEDVETLYRENHEIVPIKDCL